MSEPRKLYTGSASGGLDQEQYEAARRRAQQLAEQNARRRTVQQPMRTAQGRHISQRPAVPPQPAPEPVREAPAQPQAPEQEAPRELTYAQRQAMAYRAATERKYGDTLQFQVQRPRRTVNRPADAEQQARQAAQHRGQGCNGQHGQHGEHHAYKAAQLHGNEAVLDVALHGEQHDVAQKHQPAVIKFNDVEERVGDQDPHQQHQAEIEQKTLGNGFVHKREPPFLVLERKKCAAPVYRVLHRLASFYLQNRQLNLALKPALWSRGFSSIMEL